MFNKKISKIVKRDGRIVNFDRNKIVSSISKAAVSVHEDPLIGNRLLDQIVSFLFKKHCGRLPTVENIKSIIEDILIKNKYNSVAKAYAIYGEKRQQLIKSKKLSINCELKLSLNALKILQSRYLLRNDDGDVIETPVEMFRRVAKAVAYIDRKYEEDNQKSEEKFFHAMTRLDFLPNTPCLMNAGTKFQMLSACFVLPIEDSLNKIFDTLKVAANLQKYAGGTGFSFSRLRQKGGIIHGTKGVSSGPVSFMSLFNSMTEVIKQGSKRRGANMGILSVNHPDILEFINCKNDFNFFNNFNISVSVTDKFMDAVLRNLDYNLIDPRTKQIVQKLNARKVFENIIDSAWNTGDPGLIFIDKINKMHSLNNEIEATNPCGEQPLLAYESCVLGSINLANFVKNSDVDWSRLKEMVFTAVHFLDNVIDANDYAVKEIEEITKANRKIGLGIMGWADMLIKLEIAYDSLEALELGEKIMKFIEHNGRLASENLAKKRGNFSNFKNSKLVKHYSHQRNATITTIAPTGTISLIANVNSGIEPIFGVSYVREVLGGSFLVETNKYFEEVAKHRGFFSRNLINDLSKSGSLRNLKHVPLDVKKLFVTAFDIKSEWHIRMQAAFQKFTDNGVSKTINLSENATKEDVKKAYLLAYKLGCKGITIFRTGSKKGLQVLYTGDEYGKRLKLGSEFVGGCPIVDCGH